MERIGLWEDGGKILGAVLFDHSLDVLYPMVLPGYEYLYPAMYDYAKGNMVKEEQPEFLIYAKDTNTALQKVLRQKGMLPTEEKEAVAAFDLSGEIPSPKIPAGFHITSLEEHRDYGQYMKCLFRGFGHEENGEIFSFTEENQADCRKAYERCHVDLSLKISAVDTEGIYAAHAGLWYDKASRIALVEPVCTIPECRRMGLAREAVFEGLRRVRAMGAKIAVVGSDQPFYYALGFVPYSTGTVWKPAEQHL